MYICRPLHRSVYCYVMVPIEYYFHERSRPPLHRRSRCIRVLHPQKHSVMPSLSLPPTESFCDTQPELKFVFRPQSSITASSQVCSSARTTAVTSASSPIRSVMVPHSAPTPQMKASVVSVSLETPNIHKWKRVCEKVDRGRRRRMKTY